VSDQKTHRQRPCEKRSGRPPADLRRTRLARALAQIDDETRRRDHRLRARLTWCCTASECGRLCPRLLKGPGASQVRCLQADGRTTVDLYDALADPDFHCPDGQF